METMWGTNQNSPVHTVEMWGCSLVSRGEGHKFWEHGVIGAALGTSYIISHINPISNPLLQKQSCFLKDLPQQMSPFPHQCQAQQGHRGLGPTCLPSYGQMCRSHMRRSSSVQIQTIFFVISLFPHSQAQVSFTAVLIKTGHSKSLLNQSILVQHLWGTEFSL